MAQRLGVCAPIIAAPSLLKMSLTLVFHLNHIDNLGKGLHQFYVGQHTSSTWKVPKACVDQHQVVSGGGSAPMLADAAHLTAPNGVTLPKTVAMVQIAHTRLRVGLDTLLGREHPATQWIEAFFLALIERDIELEEYYPHNPSLKLKLPYLLTWWIQIRLLDWIAHQWERGGMEPLPHLEAICSYMDLQEPWKPTSSPGYEADKRRTFRGPNTQIGLAHSGGTGTVPMVHPSPPPNHPPQEGGHREGGGVGQTQWTGDGGGS